MQLAKRLAARMLATRMPAARILAAVIAACAACNAAAVPIIYVWTSGDSSAFEADAAAAGIALEVDHYEDLPVGTHQYGQNLVRDSYSITTASNNAGLSLSSSDSVHVIEGNISMGLYRDTDPLTFTFDNPIHAFGINLEDIDFLSYGGELQISVNGALVFTVGPAALDNLGAFLGVIDTETPINSVSLNRTSGDGYFFDSLRFEAGPSNQVPAPATLALVGLGLFGAGWIRRRQ